MDKFESLLRDLDTSDINIDNKELKNLWDELTSATETEMRGNPQIRGGNPHEKNSDMMNDIAKFLGNIDTTSADVKPSQKPEIAELERFLNELTSSDEEKQVGGGIVDTVYNGLSNLMSSVKNLVMGNQGIDLETLDTSSVSEGRLTELPSKEKMGDFNKLLDELTTSTDVKEDTAVTNNNEIEKQLKLGLQIQNDKKYQKFLSSEMNTDELKEAIRQLTY